MRVALLVALCSLVACATPGKSDIDRGVPSEWNEEIADDFEPAEWKEQQLAERPMGKTVEVGEEDPGAAMPEMSECMALAANPASVDDARVDDAWLCAVLLCQSDAKANPLPLFARLITLREADPAVWQARAECHMQRESFSVAGEDLDHALTLVDRSDPLHLELTFLLGLARYQAPGTQQAGKQALHDIRNTLDATHPIRRRIDQVLKLDHQATIAPASQPATKAALAPLALAAAPEAPAEYRSFEADGFRFRYRGKQDFAKTARFEHTVLELLREIRRRVGRYFQFRPAETLTVVLYDPADWAKLYPMAADVLGFYRHHERDLHIRKGSTLPPDGRRTLAHEYAHAVIHAASGYRGDVPYWLHEGLAQASEEIYERDFSTPEQRVLKQLRALRDLDQLPRLTPYTKRPLITAGAHTGRVYQTAHGAVWCIERRAGLSALRSYLQAMSRGTPSEEAFKRATGFRVADIDEKLHGCLEDIDRPK